MKTKILFIGMLVTTLVLAGCSPAVPDQEPAATINPTAPNTPIAPLNDDQIKNLTYQGIYNESVKLTNGQYEGEPIMEDGSSRPTVSLMPLSAYGDLNGDGVEDAAVLLSENSGGSGTFFYLAAVVNQEGEPVNSATTFLGDRVSPESIAILNGEIVIEMAAHAETDPMCCPSLKTRTSFALQVNKLTVLQTGEISSSPQTLIGTWRWIAYQDMAERNDINVPDPSKYTLVFLADGSVQITADCNSAGGGVTITGSSLTFDPLMTTLAECEPDSLYSEYLADLGDVASFVLEGDTLYLNLMMDAGTMVFDR